MGEQTPFEEISAVDEEGNRQIHKLLDNSPAFVCGNALDTRKPGYSWSKPEVFRVTYVSSDLPLPQNIGKWPVDLKSSNEATYSFGSWIEKPAVGEDLALKLSPLNEDIVNERAAMLRANRVFSLDDKARPMRLYTYGVGSTIHTFNFEREYVYLLQECLTPNFVSYKEFKETHQDIALDDAFAILLSFSGTLNKMHQAGISHGDIEGPGLEEHLHIDPTTHDLRIIDWSHSKPDIAENTVSPTIVLDHAGIGQIMKELLRTRMNEEAEASKKVIRERLAEEDPNPDDPEEYAAINTYALNAQGTEQLFNDLQQLKEIALKK
jgi:hypothetical protein